MNKRNQPYGRPALQALRAIVILLAMLAAGQVRAAWPEHTITLIVPFPPGGPTDLLGRLLAAELTTRLRNTVVVENRAGAAGNIGIGTAARATPDGYTLMVVTGVLLINPNVAKVNYDPVKDFEPIAYLGASPNVIITRPATGITNIPDLIAKAKANSGKLTYATAGVGSLSHLAVEFVKLRAGIEMIHVPYSGAVPALQAAMSGTTDIACVPIANLIGHIRAGTLKALVQTGSDHSIDLPDVHDDGGGRHPECGGRDRTVFSRAGPHAGADCEASHRGDECRPANPR